MDVKDVEKRIEVLLVDDKPDFTEPVAFWLESKGYSVVVAHDGKSAVRAIRKDRPDIVFLDLIMPVMDGIETLRHIRRFDSRLPVIVVTVAYTDREKFAEARNLGISGFFPKKGSFKRLGKIIEVTLRTHKELRKK